MAKDFYKVLGVEKGATDDEIKKAFRRLAHEHHPDKGGDPSKFKDVNEAYQVLGDATKRKTYDQFGSAAFENGGMPGGAGSGFAGDTFMYFVYVLQNISGGKLYIGASSDPKRRLIEHNAGKTVSTKPFIPYTLIYCEAYQSKTEALRRERQIKQSGKLRKEIKRGTYTAPSSIG